MNRPYFTMRSGDTTCTKRKRSFNTAVSQSLVPLYETPLKRSKPTPLKPVSKPTTMFNLDDLPDFVLVEILCRLPCEYAVQCMCVSKRWYCLVSDPYFVGRFLRLQSDNQKPIPRPTLIFKNPKHPRKFLFISKHPLSPIIRIFKNSKHTRKDLKQPLLPEMQTFSLSFLPCYRGPLKKREHEPIVVAMYNDLVLCCATKHFQCEYYICNAITKQWDALPSPPRRHDEVIVGFICDPYYKECKEDIDRRKKYGTCKPSFQLNTEYRYRVVRIIPKLPGSSLQFKAEIFSSETGKWTKTVVLCPRSFRVDKMNAGVAYNGMLYWLSPHDGVVIVLDPYSNNNVNHKYNFRFIDKPEDDRVTHTRTFDLLGVCRTRGGERLRMCQSTGDEEYGGVDCLSVWELRDDQVDNAGKWHLVGRVSLTWLVSQNPLIMEWRNQGRRRDWKMVLAFDPNDEDILYLELGGHIVTCDIRGEGYVTGFLSTPLSYFKIHPERPVFPFVFPWWPTPVARHKQASSSNHVAEEHGGPVKIRAAKDKDNRNRVTTRTRSSFRRTCHQENVVNKKGSASNTKKQSTRPCS